MALRTAQSDTGEQGGARLRYRRIVVKAGTNVLTRKTAHLDRSVMESLVDQIADVVAMGAQVVLVTSGAIAAGHEAAPGVVQGKSVAASQMLAAIGQSRLMHAYQELFSLRGIVVAQTLLIARDVDDRVGYLNVRNTLNGLLERGVVPIVNENDVVDTKEINGQRFGDNDTLSAIVANVIDADLLLMLTDTGGLFTADPNRDPTAELISRVDEIDDAIMSLAEVHTSTATRGGMASKLQAAQHATGIGVAVMFGLGGDLTVVRGCRVRCVDQRHVLPGEGVRRREQETLAAERHDEEGCGAGGGRRRGARPPRAVAQPAACGHPRGERTVRAGRRGGGVLGEWLTPRLRDSELRLVGDAEDRGRTLRPHHGTARASQRRRSRASQQYGCRLSRGETRHGNRDCNR